MAFRGCKQWNSGDSVNYKTKWTILTDSGAGLLNANGKRAAYVSVSGLINNTISGVTVFGFPCNYNYPQPVRVHPVMPYWCFAPMATAAFQIKPGETFTSTYRYYVHDGIPDQRKLEQMNNDILHPVEVTVFYK